MADLKRYRIVVSLVTLAVLLVGGCAPGVLQDEDWRDPGLQPISWPAPPQPKRIELLRVVAGEEDLQASEGGNKLLKWLIGDKGRPQAMISAYGIAADGSGRVWVADPGSALVHAYDLSRRAVRYIGQAGKTQLASPVGVVYDNPQGRLYVSDSVLRKVFVFSGSGDYLFSIDYDGFQRPSGLAVDSAGRLYVVDAQRGLIEVFGQDGTHVQSIGSASSPDGLFRHPSNIDIDADGRLYIVDSLRFRVEIQSATGELLGLVGTIGDAPGTFARPRGIAVDSSGHIYVADAAFDNIQIFDLAGRLLLYFGSPGKGPGDFCLPAGIEIDRNNRIYVAEACNHRFQIFQYLDPTGG